MSGALFRALMSALAAVLSQLITKDNLKLLADSALDWVEDFVKSTANTIDDDLVLPQIKKIREAFNIPDNDVPPDTIPE